MGVMMKRFGLVILVGVIALALVLAFFLTQNKTTAVDKAAVAIALPTVSQPAPPLAAPTPPVPTLTVPTPPAKLATVVPSFDVVRIDSGGNTVIAGRAAPGAVVKIFDNGKEIGQTTADATSGEWVFVSTTPLPPGGRQLTLSATGLDGVEIQSTEQVVLAVPADRTSPTIAVRMPRSGQAAAKPTPDSGPIALSSVPKLMQGGQALPAGKGLALDAINYDEQGHVVIVGRATVGGTVTVLMDGKPVGNAVAGPDGQWVITPSQIASEGKHLVHAELRETANVAGNGVPGSGGPSGAVVAFADRVFFRVEVAGMPDGLRVVVVPGNNLWVIASHTYGEGRLYTMIYDANKGQINNPNLIYPGQVFVLPKSDNMPKSDKPAP